MSHAIVGTYLYLKIIQIILKNSNVIECCTFLFAKSGNPNLEGVV